MDYREKRNAALDEEAVQAGNRSWWTSQTMSYDWKEKSEHARFTLPWYDQVDRRFLDSARLYSDAPNPFEALMGADLAGRSLLEIGCGMGLHTEMLVRAGARVTSIDLSPTSAEATRKRLQLKGLECDVREMDAENLAFDAGAFDRVWSWGVIHHSSRTGRIVREIERVLRPGGDARLMVYNLGGMPAYAAWLGNYLGGFWRGRPLDEVLWRSTDGFSARFYTPDGFRDLLATFFGAVDVRVLGSEADAIPLPRALRRLVAPLVPIERQRAAAVKRGSFLFAVARKDG